MARMLPLPSIYSGGWQERSNAVAIHMILYEASVDW